MHLIRIEGLTPSVTAEIAAGPTIDRGTDLARRGAVLQMSWDTSAAALWGVVRGSSGAYETVAYLAQVRDGRIGYAGSECSCPVGFDCKHVIALVLTATGDVTGPPAAARARTWEDELGELVGQAGAAALHGDPVALELALSRVGGSGLALPARLLRPGRTGWVVGGLSWQRITTPWSAGDLRQDHVRLLRELYSLTEGTTGYHGYGRSERTIDLLGCDSARLWPLLDEAAEIGIALVHQGRAREPVARPGDATFHFDVTAGEGDGGLVIAPRIRIADPLRAETDLWPVAFVGADGHGVVLVPRAQIDGADPTGWSFSLARLVPPAPPALQRTVLADRRLTVPGDQRSRFATEFFHGLSRLAPVESSDGAFTPPQVSAPGLVLRAVHGPGHKADLRWEWDYEIDGTSVRVPVGTGGESFRTPDREAKALTEFAALGMPAVLDPRSGHRLTGSGTARFATEAVPRLAEAGIRVEQEGELLDYRDAGDSLRIGLSTSESSGGTDWFDLGVTVSVEDREVPFATVFGALASGEEDLLLPDGAWFSLRTPQLQALAELIAEARTLQDRPSGPIRLSRFQAGLWEDLAELGEVHEQATAWRDQVGGLLALGRTGGVTDPAEPPAGLTATLRDYQRHGYDWLTLLWRHGLGGILADDMGLGKTVQTIALLARAREDAPGAPPFLIVAPTSVVGTWAAELARFAPGLRAVAVTDTLRKRGTRLPELADGADVVITSYTLFRIDAQDHQEAAWSGLVLDEAQFVKNHRSQAHRCARLLRAPFKLAVTGTPMENDLLELWSLLAITAPGLFPSPDRFKELYARPIERDHDAEALARLRRRIRPLMLRRTKEQVAADLPDKQIQRYDVDLDPQHRRLYQRHLQRERQKVLGLLDDVDRNRFTILRSLTLLRRLSLHPGLVEPDRADRGSSKIDALVERLTEIAAGGHRALVFSQFTGFLDHVRRRLDAEGVEYVYLDGKTRDRSAVVRRFTQGTAPAFLISLKAGGFGLTLTEADYCFLLDPWWNPAVEAQAIDRTHRIGQTRNVMVYRMIARNTIEEKVAELADRKAELFRGVMDDGEAFTGSLDADDIRALLR